MAGGVRRHDPEQALTAGPCDTELVPQMVMYTDAPSSSWKFLQAQFFPLQALEDLVCSPGLSVNHPVRNEMSDIVC